MRKRINLLALLVIGAGGAVIGRPTPASATLAPSPAGQFGSCCEAWFNGRRIAYCCAQNGCFITRSMCLPYV